MPRALTNISGIGPAAAEVLKQHGFRSAEGIAKATIEELSQVPGFGAIRAENTIKAAIEVTGSSQPAKIAPAEPIKEPDAKSEKKAAKEKKKPKKDKKSKNKKSKDKKEKKSKDKKKSKKSGKDKKKKKK